MPIETTTAAEPAVRVSGLEYHYPDGRHALRGVEFEIARGDSVALVGPNGAGKSTLLLHLNGLLPGRDRAAVSAQHDHAGDLASAAKSVGRWMRSNGSAHVWIDGLPMTDANAPEIRRRVGLLFQDPDDQLFSTTVLEDVAFGPLNLGMSRNEARSLALECLERVGLAEAARRPPHHLSFGERKRVCLAGVLACRPSVLVLDEPSANLDPRGRRRFIELIRALPATKLIATHDLEMVLELCARSILLDGGKVVAQGPSQELLFQTDLLEAHGLETPMSLRTRPAESAVIPPDLNPPGR